MFTETPQVGLTLLFTLFAVLNRIYQRQMKNSFQHTQLIKLHRNRKLFA